MLKIRNSQMDAFLPKEESEIVDFVVEHLHEEHPGLVKSIDPQSLREMVSNGLARARSHGLRTLAPLTEFVALMFQIAPNFDEQPSIRSALRDTSIPEESRIERMFDTVPDAAWDRAESDYDTAAWFPEA